MDIRTDNSFEEATVYEVNGRLQSISSPFPADDYDKKGNLKKVRFRMLKKLLKYEFRYYLPTMLIGIGILLLSAVALTVLHITNVDPLVFDRGYGAVLALFQTLYAYANIGVIVLPIGLFEKRFRKSFFKSQGAVTLSIPASEEEHICAKYVGMFAMLLAAIAAIFIGVCIQSIAMPMIWQIWWELPLSLWTSSLTVAEKVLHTLEWLLWNVELFAAVPCLIGTGCCLTQKYSDKKRFAVSFLLSFALMFLLTGGIILFFTTGLYELWATPLGRALFTWIGLILGAVIVWLSLRYQIRTLKYKIDL